MMNFTEFSRNSFLNFVNTLEGFITYKNDGNRIIVANRFGKVFKWSIKSDGTIQQNEITYNQPGLLTDIDLEWLKSIARKKHWRGGVAKLDSYTYMSDTELNAKGIDPYFYAWMASRHYVMDLGGKADVNTMANSVTEDDYEVLTDLANRICCKSDDDFSAIVISFGTAKSNGLSASDFAKAETRKHSTLYADILDLVEKYLPCVDGEDYHDAVKEFYHALVELGAE